jgi:hypothetical protein
LVTEGTRHGLRLLFPSRPSPPTDHREILKKQKPTAQKFFGEKISGKWDLQLCEFPRKSAAITGSIEGHAPYFGVMAMMLIVTVALCWGLAHI